MGDPTHLADYWGVITRRLWLVLIIFGVTTASAIWAVARQQQLYESYLTMQVNDPIEPARGLVNAPRVVGLDNIFVDPIISEIEVLRSSQVASGVVESLGLRLLPQDGSLVRSDLFEQPEVSPDLGPSTWRIAYDQEGSRAQLLDDTGVVVAESQVGTRLGIEGTLTFVVQPPPGEERVYSILVVPARSVYGEVSGNLAAVPKENTNIIDVSYTSNDPFYADEILNAAAQELRQLGARRVSRLASSDIEFIEEQLDSARAARAEAADAIQSFKESREFTTLTSREQTLIDQQQRIQDDVRTIEQEQAALLDIAVQIERVGALAVDFPGIQASLPPGTNPEIGNLIDDIRARRTEQQRLLNEDRLAASHPRVLSVELEIRKLGDDIVQAVNSRLGVIETEIARLVQREQEIRREQAQFPNLEAQLRALEQQQETDDEFFIYLQNQLVQARIRQSATSPYVEVIDPAFGASPIEPRGQLNIFLGGLLGLILGVGAAFFLEYLDRTVRTSSDVEGLLGVPVLGVIPRLRRLDEEGDVEMHGKAAPLVVALDPLDPAAEAYRNLRMNLMFMSTKDEPIGKILFSSPGPDEGKSTTAVNFAVMLAQQGQRVLLIDADLRRPSLHRSLDLLREPGLTNLLIGDAEPREAVRPNVLPNLDVLPSGPFPPNPSELLNSRTMAKLLEDFEGKYTQIIVDSPPILAVTDASVLAGHVDGVVMVLRSGETEQRAAERAVDQLRRLNVRIFGAVLNEVSIGANDESYYLQYYYHYSEPRRSWLQKVQGATRGATSRFFG